MNDTTPRLSKEEILRRAQKLMAFTSGNATQNEIDVAAEMLGKLLRENNISMSDIPAAQIKSEVEEIDHKGSYTKLPGWYVRLAQQIAGAISCEMLLCQVRKNEKIIRFIGVSSDVQIAAFFMDVCSRELPLMEKRANPWDRIAYLTGCGVSIGSRLRKMYQPEDISVSERGLISTKSVAITEFKEEAYGDRMKPVKIGKAGRDMDSYRQGMEDAEKMKLNQGLRSSHGENNLLT